MPLPSQLTLSNTFGQWVNVTNDIITAVGNTSEYILVAQNASPATSTGNVSVNGTITVVNLTANGILSGNGVSVSSLNASALTTGTVPLGRLSSANSSANGVVDTTTQTFAGNKTFDNNVAIIGYLTVGNSTITLNSTTLVLGNASSNLVMNSSAVLLDGSQIINSSGTANNATNLNGQPATYYTNASNISSGTLPIAQLDANVLLTTSTTGINASALSTGTVPLAQLISANSVSNGIVNITTQTFAGNKTFSNDVSISGNLNVLGTTTTVSANNLIVDDSLIQLAANNTTSDLLDIGLYGNYNADGGSHEHAGFFRDATDQTWKLFEGLQESPTTTVNTSGTGYTQATLRAYLSSAALTTNATVLAIAANSSYHANLTINTLSVSGVANVLGTLGVTGATNALSTLGVSGIFTALANSTLTGAVTISNTSVHTGAATFSSTILMNGNSSSGMTANGKLTLNTTNGRFVLPVGVDLWAL